MATYRAIAYIPTSAILPSASEPTTITQGELTRALNAVSAFPDAVFYYSAGMCTIDLSIRVINETLPSSTYFTYNSQNILFPAYVATHVDDINNYDMVILLNGAEMTSATTFRGLGGSSSGTPYIWAKIGSIELDILVHELLHAMTVYLGSSVGTYTNFPQCGAEPSAHCGTAYGFESDVDPGWFSGFLQGTLSDGTGINATGWSVQTPTERGLKTRPKVKTSLTLWGRIPPLRIRA